MESTVQKVFFLFVSVVLTAHQSYPSTFGDVFVIQNHGQWTIQHLSWHTTQLKRDTQYSGLVIPYILQVRTSHYTRQVFNQHIKFDPLISRLIPQPSYYYSVQTICLLNNLTFQYLKFLEIEFKLLFFLNLKFNLLVS